MTDNDREMMAKGIYFTYGEVIKAYKACIKNKRNTEGAIDFSVSLMRKLRDLCDEINDGPYAIGKSTTFVVTYPVPREVFAADFRDRIVHHLVINEMLPYLEGDFIDNSFSCREGKGVQYGVRVIEEEMRKCSENYTKPAWVAKLDMKSFFMTIDKKMLADRVDEFIVTNCPWNRKTEKLRWLCNLIIMHHPEKNCERRCPAKLWDRIPAYKSLFGVGETHGLPIGNLTSQLFANFFLTPMDKYITEELGFKRYGRYVDDFVIVSDDKEQLLKAIPLIDKFAREKLRLTVHPDKRYIQEVKKGVRFIGTVIKPNRKYILKRTAGTLRHKVATIYSEPCEADVDKLVQVVNSYLGFMRANDSYNVRKRLLSSERENILGKWVDAGLITIDSAYRKISRKEKRMRPSITVNDARRGARRLMA